MVLDDIKKAFPNLEVFWPYMELLNKESDRGAVLISTGFLEQQLRDILAAFMCEGTSAPLLDGANAPLGRFSSRISACHALGLITANEHNDLNILRRVRNDFAHDIHTSFETQSVIDRCANLKHRAMDYDSKELGKVRVGTGGQFRTAATGVILNLLNRAHYVKKHRRTEGEWPR
jgi:hypothetical protein